MAFIEWHPQDSIKKSIKSQLGFSLIVGLALMVIMLIFSDDLKKDLTAILTIVGVIGAVMILVLYKLNPLAWKKIFNRKEFERFMNQEGRVIDTLRNLDDSYFVLNDFSFELFHVEHLVVSDKGVFIIGKVRDNGVLNISDNTLFAGDISLETLTGRLWRLCHLVNLITKKGFNGAEIMPKPILVLPDTAKAPFKDFNGIRIAGIDELNDVIEKSLKFSVEKNLAEGFAFFIKERYILNR
jgi:hypothetical protein